MSTNYYHGDNNTLLGQQRSSFCQIFRGGNDIWLQQHHSDVFDRGDGQLQQYSTAAILYCGDDTVNKLHQRRYSATVTTMIPSRGNVHWCDNDSKLWK